MVIPVVYVARQRCFWISNDRYTIDRVLSTVYFLLGYFDYIYATIAGYFIRFGSIAEPTTFWKF